MKRCTVSDWSCAECSAYKWSSIQCRKSGCLTFPKYSPWSWNACLLSCVEKANLLNGVWKQMIKSIIIIIIIIIVIVIKSCFFVRWWMRFVWKQKKIYLMFVFEVCRRGCYPLVLWFGDIKCSRPTSCRKLKQKNCQEFFSPTMITK